MKFVIALTTIGMLVGLFFGASTGVVGGWGAINGAFVFVPIGGVIGFLAAIALKKR